MRCPICGFLVRIIPVTQTVIVFVKCRKCKFDGAFSSASCGGFCSITTASYGEWKSFPGRRLGKDMYFDQEAFGKCLKELRNIKGMTQEELAEKLNISREHLGRIECGKYGCSIDLLIELSYTLNASTDYLLLGRNPDRDQDRKQLLQVISQLSDIARNM